MSEKRISTRYAKSLIDLAVEQKQLDVIYNDMVMFRNACKASPEIKGIYKSPIIDTPKKLSITKDIFGKNLNALTLAFLNIIIQKHREMYLSEIAEEFIAQYNVMKNITKAYVTTASELSKSVKEEITNKIMQQTGMTVQLETKVNPELIGGMVVKIGDKLYDSSISTQLSNLKRELINK